MEELISDHLQLGLKGNQELGPITEVTVLEISGTDKIRELYRAIWGFPGTPNGIESATKKETENGRGSSGGFKK